MDWQICQLNLAIKWMQLHDQTMDWIESRAGSWRPYSEKKDV